MIKRPARYIWHNGDPVPWNEATVHVTDHIMHYGGGVFEGIKAHKGDDGNLYVLALHPHMARFYNSAKIEGVEIPYKIEELEKAILQTLAKNNIREDAYIRPIAGRGPGDLGISAENKIDVAIIVFEVDEYLPGQATTAMITPFQVPSPLDSSSESKNTDRYGTNRKAGDYARLHKYGEAILINSLGRPVEGSGQTIYICESHILYPKTLRLVTPKISEGALNGITRAITNHKIAEKMGIEVVEGEITRGGLYTAKESFFTGTASAIKPIKSVDGKPIGDGSIGKIARGVGDIYERIIRGTALDLYDDLTPVY